MQKTETSTVIYGIANCDTVKKARAWFATQGIESTFYDFKKQGVPAAQLKAWFDQFGADNLINRRGTTWRKLPADQQSLANTPEAAFMLVQQHPSLLRRPIVEWAPSYIPANTPAVTLGFSAPDWQGRAANKPISPKTS